MHEEKGEGDPAETGRHDGEKFAQVDIFDGEFDLVGAKTGKVLAETKVHGDGAESAVAESEGLGM